jgi:hypothetical protein
MAGAALIAVAIGHHVDILQLAGHGAVGYVVPGDHQSRGLGLGGDVAEPHGGKHSDGEVRAEGMRQAAAIFAGSLREA